MNKDFEAQCKALVIELGLGKLQDIVSIQPLTGGVSSDIALVTLSDRKICVKAALAELKVAAQWRAPVHRNATEYRWLSCVAGFLPESVPRLYGESKSLGAFAMEYLDPSRYQNWKTSLLAGSVDPETARALGAALGRIHGHSTTPSFDVSGFQNKDDFHALRLEPYLEFTANQHPLLRETLFELSHDFHVARIALVHGDVSPKNIMVGPGGPVLLDAECAVMGDPAFDLAFCMNHFLLKAIHQPRQAVELSDLVGHFWDAYQTALVWESPSGLEARVARLLPALMLARVDGKSPAEYLNPAQQDVVRTLAVPFIRHAPSSLDPILSTLLETLRP